MGCRSVRGRTAAFTIAVTVGILSSALRSTVGGAPHPAAADALLSARIQHIVIIMQENRSFDTYFGTFPGAEGIPPGICLPNPLKGPGGCDAPFHDTADLNYGAPHGNGDAVAAMDNGKMDGFV